MMQTSKGNMMTLRKLVKAPQLTSGDVILLDPVDERTAVEVVSASRVGSQWKLTLHDHEGVKFADVDADRELTKVGRV